MHVYIKAPKQREFLLAITYLFSVLICYFFIDEAHQKTYCFYMFILSFAIMFAVLAELVVERQIKTSDILFWISILILGSVMAFRAQTGIDDWNYKNYFALAGNYNLFEYVKNQDLESGYAILNYILYRLTNGNYNVAQVIITYISFILWGFAIRSNKKHCSYFMMILLLWTHYYFLIMSAGLVRIFIAIPIVFIALNKLLDKKLLQYTILILVASLFHISALIMLVLLVLYSCNEYFVKHWILFVIAISIFVLIAFVWIARFLAPALGARYYGYSEIRRLNLSISDFDTLPILLVGAYYFRYIPASGKRRYVLALILTSMSMIFSIFSSMVSLGRLVYYTNIGILILISEISKSKVNNMVDNLIPVLLIAYAFFYVMHTSFCNAYQIPNIFPYRSFWTII